MEGKNNKVQRKENGCCQIQSLERHLEFLARIEEINYFDLEILTNINGKYSNSMLF